MYIWKYVSTYLRVRYAQVAFNLFQVICTSVYVFLYFIGNLWKPYISSIYCKISVFYKVKVRILHVLNRSKAFLKRTWYIVEEHAYRYLHCITIPRLHVAYKCSMSPTNKRLAPKGFSLCGPKLNITPTHISLAFCAENYVERSCIVECFIQYTCIVRRPVQ